MQSGCVDDAATIEELRARINAIEADRARVAAELAGERARADALAAERDRLRAAYQQALFELQLLRKRIFVAKAERVDTRQLEIEFASKSTALAAIARELGEPAATDILADANAGDVDRHEPPSPPKPRAKPKGRRNLDASDYPIDRHELLDPDFERLVAEGKAERIGFEESSQIGWRKGGPVRVVMARAKYKTTTPAGESTVITVPLPKRTFGRCLADASLLAKIIVDKFADGLPLFRQEQRFEREGLSLDRGTMCRWIEDVGMTVGCVVLAMKQEALKTAFCIATDATGIAIQPEASNGRGRRPCRRGHFFALLADCDHIVFEYTPRETSKAVAAMLKGFSGFVQADAKSVYDVLFRAMDGPTLVDTDEDGCVEVGCWAHARRKFFEAAIAKDKAAREALFRIHRLFEFEESWSRSPPSQRRALRLEHTKPLLDDFFAWAAREYERVKATRGLLRSAFGYVVRQRSALCRFLEDGRLKVDNNASERALRPVAVGRKAWLFVGSDDHAQATANIFSLIASCRLHRLDPEVYFRDVIRVLVHWPRDRYLELAPKYWSQTRARLDEPQLKLPCGDLTIPPPPEQQPSPG